MSYVPSPEILEKYAKVLVNFALGDGKGIKEDDVVYLLCPVSALPFHTALNKVLIDSGAIIINGLTDDTSGTASYYYEHANQKQLTAFLSKYYKGLVDSIDHYLGVLSDYDLHELDKADPKKIMLKQKSGKQLHEWMDAKERKGKFSWTIALYGTASVAKEAGLTQKEYWGQIIRACYLDKADPIAEWRKISKESKRVSKQLTTLKIEKLHIVGKDTNLELKIGTNRRWVGGGGRNIPSFEVFTSPDWRGTEGWIRFNQPLYRYGKIIRGIEFHFSKGRVIKATAKENQAMLTEMLATDLGASQLGEFSLTDRRASRITKFMAHTLFDENVGGEFGNTHLAVGKSFADAYGGGSAKLTKKVATSLGFNDSVIHTDMVSTTDRTVTATLKDGTQKVIYKKGQFTI